MFFFSFFLLEPARSVPEICDSEDLGWKIRLNTFRQSTIPQNYHHHHHHHHHHQQQQTNSISNLNKLCCNGSYKLIYECKSKTCKDKGTLMQI